MNDAAAQVKVEWFRADVSLPRFYVARRGVIEVAYDFLWRKHLQVALSLSPVPLHADNMLYRDSGVFPKSFHYLVESHRDLCWLLLRSVTAPQSTGFDGVCEISARKGGRAERGEG